MIASRWIEQEYNAGLVLAWVSDLCWSL